MTAGQSTEALFGFAKAAARAGHKAEARRLLWAALQLEPDRADLWIWLAGVAPSPRAAMGYLARALTLEPHNRQAQAGLRWARRLAAEHRPLVTTPARPAGPPVRRRPAWTWAAGLAGVALVLIILGVLGAVLVPDLVALAAADLPPTVTSRIVWLPTATIPPLPTRTRELPPTWTPTPTHTPSPTATPSSTPTPSPTITPTPVYPSPTWVPTLLPTPVPLGSNGERWIDVDLSEQLLIAYEGYTPVQWVLVSTGLPRTPTVVGRYRIYVKYEATLMSGDDYYLPNVPHTMYFYQGYGLHGAYWHNNFGRPMSHGCVNLPLPEAEWLYNWASVGTVVNIHY